MHEKFMIEAIKEANKSLEINEVPVGAVIVKNGKIISRGHNIKEKKQSSLAHAEIIAIEKATRKVKNWRLIDCDIYVTLEPCPMCAGAIGWAHIGRLVYGASDPKHGYSVFAPSVLHPRTEVVTGILDEESSSLLKRFFKGKR